MRGQVSSMADSVCSHMLSAVTEGQHNGEANGTTPANVSVNTSNSCITITTITTNSSNSSLPENKSISSSSRSNSSGSNHFLSPISSGPTATESRSNSNNDNNSSCINTRRSGNRKRQNIQIPPGSSHSEEFKRPAEAVGGCSSTRGRGRFRSSVTELNTTSEYSSTDHSTSRSPSHRLERKRNFRQQNLSKSCAETCKYFIKTKKKKRERERERQKRGWGREWKN